MQFVEWSVSAVVGAGKGLGLPDLGLGVPGLGAPAVVAPGVVAPGVVAPSVVAPVGARGRGALALAV